VGGEQKITLLIGKKPKEKVMLAFAAAPDGMLEGGKGALKSVENTIFRQWKKNKSAV